MRHSEPEILYLTSSDAGRRLNLSAAAVRAACNRGEIAVCARTAGGARLIRPEEIDRVQREREAKRGGHRG